MNRPLVAGVVGALAWFATWAPVSRADEAKTIFDVRVPQYSDVWVLGEKTHQRGMDREFITPDLSTTRVYRYTIRARWVNTQGQTIDELREMPVRGGQRVLVDFFQTAPSWQRVVMLSPAEPMQQLPAAETPMPRTYTSFYRELPASQPASPISNRAAVLRVKVPQNAQVWLGKEKTHQGGTLRTFATPNLAPNKEYFATIKAQWMNSNGLEVEQSRRVELHPGDRITVDFTAPPPPPQVQP